MKFKVRISEENSYTVFVDTDELLRVEPDAWLDWEAEGYDKDNEEDMKEFVRDTLTSEGLDIFGVSDPVDRETGYWDFEEIRRI